MRPFCGMVNAWPDLADVLRKSINSAGKTDRILQPDIETNVLLQGSSMVNADLEIKNPRKLHVCSHRPK